MRGKLNKAGKKSWEYYDGLQVMFNHQKMKSDELFRNMQAAWKGFYSWPRTIGYLARGKFNDAIVNLGGRVAANRIRHLNPV